MVISRGEKNSTIALEFGCLDQILRRSAQKSVGQLYISSIPGYPVCEQVLKNQTLKILVRNLQT